MTDWSATGVPALRRDLVDSISWIQSRMPTDETSGLPGALSVAELWWVTRDMCKVTAGAAADIPEWTPAAVFPSPAGIVVFQQPPAIDVADAVALSPLPIRSRAPRRIDGIAWSVERGVLRVWTLSRRTDAQERTVTEFAARLDQPSPPTSELMLLGESIRIPVAEVVPATVEIDALSVLGTVWILAQTPTVVTPRQVTGQGTSAARWRREDRTVTIVDMRPIQTERGERETAHDGREYHHRWIVRGHWRQQAVGPKRGQRRPTWIAPHVKGPEGAPLLDTDHVMVWRR